MTRILRYAFVALLAVGSTASFTGCKGNCDNDGGTTTCVGETTVEYLSSTPVEKDVPWTAGQAVKISVAGGKVRTGSNAATSITVNPGTGSTVHVKFTAINNDTKENRDKAIQQMKLVEEGGSLSVSAAAAGNDIQISAGPSNANGAFSTGLSALVDVFLPAGFDGDIVANTEAGDVSVIGARASVGVKTGLGDVAVNIDGVPATNAATYNITSDLGDISVALAAAPTEATVLNGTILTDQGNVAFDFPTASVMQIQALASKFDNVVTLNPAAPAGWKQNEGSTTTAMTVCGNAACDGHGTSVFKVTSNFGAVNLNFK